MSDQQQIESAIVEDTAAECQGTRTINRMTREVGTERASLRPLRLATFRDAPWKATQAIHLG